MRQPKNTPHRRALYTRLGQYGLIRSGLEAAPRRHQLRLALSSTPLALASLDIQNAHTSIARIAVYFTLASEYARTGHVLDYLECLYFLSVYSHANLTFIQSSHELHQYAQTDALQQGEADASHAFGHVIARLITDHLLPAVPSLAASLIHDDTLFEAPALTVDADADGPTIDLVLAAISAAAASATAAATSSTAAAASDAAAAAATAAAADPTVAPSAVAALAAAAALTQDLSAAPSAAPATAPAAAPPAAATAPTAAPAAPPTAAAPPPPS